MSSVLIMLGWSEVQSHCLWPNDGRVIRSLGCPSSFNVIVCTEPTGRCKVDMSAHTQKAQWCVISSGCRLGRAPWIIPEAPQHTFLFSPWFLNNYCQTSPLPNSALTSQRRRPAFSDQCLPLDLLDFAWCPQASLPLNNEKGLCVAWSSSLLPWGHICWYRRKREQGSVKIRDQAPLSKWLLNSWLLNRHTEAEEL